MEEAVSRELMMMILLLGILADHGMRRRLGRFGRGRGGRCMRRRFWSGRESGSRSGLLRKGRWSGEEEDVVER